MRRLSILLLIAGVSGCAATPPDPWAAIPQASTTEAAQPIDVPDFPIPEVAGGRAVFDHGQIVVLDEIREACLANTALSESHARQIDDLRGALDSLSAAGRTQRATCELLREQLETERRHWLFERIGYWFFIVALGVAAL